MELSLVIQELNVVAIFGSFFCVAYVYYEVQVDQVRGVLCRVFATDQDGEPSASLHVVHSVKHIVV